MACFEDDTVGTAGRTTDRAGAGEVLGFELAPPLTDVEVAWVEVPISDGGAFVDVCEVICSLVPTSRTPC